MYPSTRSLSPSFQRSSMVGRVLENLKELSVATTRKVRSSGEVTTVRRPSLRKISSIWAWM
jgi:hypothetical protein